ncbi:MAG: hypothetical protein NC124_20655 [Clostridium sp.]|nr:hypothetical protein [Roseburia sp.]MCM1500876.1 hypothetical protein [Clostridium sp.]
MEKRWIRVLGVTVFLGVLSVHASRGWVFGEKEKIHPLDMEAVDNTEISDETESQDNALFWMDTEINTEAEEENESESETIVFYGNTKILEEDLFKADFEVLEGGPDIYGKIRDYSEEVKGEFAPVIPEDTTLPEGLITLMEEAFYNSANANSRNSDIFFMTKK